MAARARHRGARGGVARTSVAMVCANKRPSSGGAAHGAQQPAV
jgi:hypothetical protein